MEAVEIDENWVAPSYPHSEDEVVRLTNYVSKTVLLSHVEGQAKASLIGAFQKMNYSQGDEIIQQGADADYYYILDSGHADVWKSANGALNPTSTSPSAQTRPHRGP